MSDEEQTSIESSQPPIRIKSNHALWLGPLIVLVGAISYFTFFVQYPTWRDTPYINLPVVLAGAWMACVGAWRAFFKSHLYRGKILGTLSLFFSLSLAGLFGTYIVYLSYQLPAPNEITQGLESAPDFTLNDQHGNPVSLSDFNGKKLIVTFYRGYW